MVLSLMTAECRRCLEPRFSVDNGHFWVVELGMHVKSDDKMGPLHQFQGVSRAAAFGISNNGTRECRA